MDDMNEDLFALGQNYLTLYNINYVYRLKTNAIYQQGRVYIFDVFVIQRDAKLEEFRLFANLWKETLILSQVNDPRLPRIVSFGQLPGNIIYREIEENQGYSLEEYIKEKETSTRIKQKSLKNASRPQIAAALGAQSMGGTQAASLVQISQTSAQESSKTGDPEDEAHGHRVSHHSHTKSQMTFFTEVESIDISLKIIDLLDLIHSQNVVHTNLCPSEIFLRDKKLT